MTTMRDETMTELYEDYIAKLKAERHALYADAEALRARAANLDEMASRVSDAIVVLKKTGKVNTTTLACNGLQSLARQCPLGLIDLDAVSAAARTAGGKK